MAGIQLLESMKKLYYETANLFRGREVLEYEDMPAPQSIIEEITPVLQKYVGNDEEYSLAKDAVLLRAFDAVSNRKHDWENKDILTLKKLIEGKYFKTDHNSREPLEKLRNAVMSEYESRFLPAKK